MSQKENENTIQYRNQPENEKYMKTIFKEVSEEESIEEDDGGGGDSSGGMTSTTDIAGPATRLGLTHKRPKMESFADYVLKTSINEGTWDFDLEGAKMIKDLLERLQKDIFYHLVGDDIFFDNIDNAIKRIEELMILPELQPNYKKNLIKQNPESIGENGTDFSLALSHGLKDFASRVTPTIKKTFVKHLKDMGDK